MKLRAYGKINLSLFVTGRLGRLHTLDSIMTTVSVFDELTVTEADEVSVVFSNADISRTDNTAYKAAKLVEEECGLKLAVGIKKGIPIGGGMGGSSADGAAVLWAAEKLAGADIKKLAPKIGSDVYFMTIGGAARVRGVGDVVEPIDFCGSFDAFAIDAGSVSTPECYKLYDEIGGSGKPNTNDELCRALARGELSEALLVNDLAPAAIRLCPNIAYELDHFAAIGLNAHVTGSGGCIFAVDRGGSKPLVGARPLSYLPYGVEEVL